MSVTLLRRRDAVEGFDRHHDVPSTADAATSDASTRGLALERLDRWIDEGDAPNAGSTLPRGGNALLASPADRLGKGALRMLSAEMRKEATDAARVAAGHVARNATAKVARFFGTSGERKALLALSQVRHRVLANLANAIPAKVEAHILEHLRVVEGKAAHSQFAKGTSMQRITELMRETTRAGARPILSVSDDGALVFVLEKEFPRATGAQGEKALRMVVDLQGRLVTAFPIAAEKKLATLSVRGVTVAASVAPVVFLSALAETEAEAACADARTRTDAAQRSNWLESVLEFVGPYGILESSPIAVEPDFSAISERTKQAFVEARTSLGRELTSDEQSAIKECINGAWTDAGSTTRGGYRQPATPSP